MDSKPHSKNTTQGAISKENNFKAISIDYEEIAELEQKLQISYINVIQVDKPENCPDQQNDVTAQTKFQKTCIRKTLDLINIPQNNNVGNNIAGYMIWVVIMNLLFWNSTKVCQGVEADNLMSCIRELKQVLFTIIQIVLAGFIYVYMIIKMLKDKFYPSKAFIFVIAILNAWAYTKFCKGFNLADHSQANMILFFLVVLVLVLCYVFYLTVLLSKWLDLKYFQATRQNSYSCLSKSLTFVKTRRCFLSYMFTLFLIFGYFLIFKVARSCDYMNQTLLSVIGIREDIGECKYKKMFVCWHQLTMNWDSILYDNSFTCKDSYFDDMIS